MILDGFQFIGLSILNLLASHLVCLSTNKLTFCPTMTHYNHSRIFLRLLCQCMITLFIDEEWQPCLVGFAFSLLAYTQLDLWVYWICLSLLPSYQRNGNMPKQEVHQQQRRECRWILRECRSKDPRNSLEEMNGCQRQPWSESSMSWCIDRVQYWETMYWE